MSWKEKDNFAALNWVLVTFWLKLAVDVTESQNELAGLHS